MTLKFKKKFLQENLVTNIFDIELENSSFFKSIKNLMKVEIKFKEDYNENKNESHPIMIVLLFLK